MDIWELMVLLGSIGFIVCTIPQGVRTWKTRRADDISWTFVILVIFSSAIMLPPLIRDGTWSFAAAQAVNVVVWGLVLVFKAKPRAGRRVIEAVEEKAAAVKEAVVPPDAAVAATTSPKRAPKAKRAAKSAKAGKARSG